MNEYEDKIELMNYLNVLWKRKWFILIATFILITAAAVISLLAPPKLKVDAIFMPSIIFIRTEGGRLSEIPFVRAAITINRGDYNNIIATELGLDIKYFPELKAKNPEATNLVHITIEEKDVEKAKLILHSLCNQLKRDFDKMADVEKAKVDSQIKSNEIEKSILEGEIKANKNKLDIIEQRKPEIEKEMNDIRKNIEELKKERHLILKKKDRSEFESFIMLHYSNEIQHSSMNHNILNESLGNNKNEEEIISLEIKDKGRLIDKIENQIDDLNERKGGIYYSKITKKPTSSISPGSPKMLTNVLIAGILGLLISGMLAFFLEYIEKQKSKLKT